MTRTASADRGWPRVAVIGSGYWGKNLVRNFHELGALAAICDSDAATRRSFQATYPACRTFGRRSNEREQVAITCTP